MSPNDSGQLSLTEGNIPVTQISTNVETHVIQVTEDKLRIILDAYGRSVSQYRDWIAAGGIFLSLIISLLTTEFRDAFGFPADFWRTVFIIATVVAALWTLRTGWRAFRHPPYTVSRLVELISGRSTLRR